MVKLTQSLSQWLWANHREIYALVLLGHVELITDDMWDAYIAWCKTDDGKQYLKGGAKYKDTDGTGGKTMVSFNICEGNPGALMFLIDAYQKHMFLAERAFQRMQDNGITGCQLYMFWNDCCSRDAGKAVNLMLEWPVGKIVQHINLEGGRGIPAFDETRENHG